MLGEEVRQQMFAEQYF